MSSDSPIKVSVAMITYNHEEFIAKALDSVLMQRTNFDYEIVIGEDCSTDNTRNIIIDYQKRHPDKFRLLLNEKNLGMHRNAAQVHHACKGEYIALLEGDDYWTSPHKLQKQVDFLESHPECAICFHNVTEVYKDGSRESHSFHNNQKAFSTVEDLLPGNFIPTPSTMFRNGLVTELPEWWFSLQMGDWPLHILNARHGKIGYINEVMAVHLNHPAGVWFRMTESWLERNKASIVVYDHLYTHLEAKYRPIIARLLHELCLRIAREYENMGELTSARSYAMRSFTKHFLVSRKSYKILLRLYVPILYKLLRSLKRATYLIMKKIYDILARLSAKIQTSFGIYH
jgi:glycosyltransferase involved in cell wall biosynthesis